MDDKIAFILSETSWELEHRAIDDPDQPMTKKEVHDLIAKAFDRVAERIWIETGFIDETYRSRRL